MLIVAGLARRGSIMDGITGAVQWLDSCFSTKAGRNAAEAINTIFDWDDFVFKGTESPSEASDQPAEVDTVAELLAAPKRISVGSLVRHQHHGLGMVIDHFMWDGDWGGFKIKLVKPSQTGPTTSISEFSDRADAFQLVC